MAADAGARSIPRTSIIPDMGPHIQAERPITQEGQGCGENMNLVWG